MAEAVTVGGSTAAQAIPSAAPRRPQKRMILAGIAAIAGVLITAVAWRRESGSAPQYVTVAATRGTVAPAVTSSGTVNPVTTIQVGSYVSGVIQTIRCDFNTRVKAGQLCARIDPRPYRTVVEQEAAALGTARAQLAKDRANLSFATLIQQRNADLLKRGIVSQETADTSNNGYEQAKAQLAFDEASVAQHEAQLKSARINLGYTDIVSPVDGTVVSRNVTQGQTVAASFQTPTLFLIATDLTKMQVDTNVSESDIGRVAVGNMALFTVTAFPDRQFKGVVEQVRQAPQTVQNVVTYDVVVAVPNADLALKPGMTASMRIVTSQMDGVLRVPDQALRYRPSAHQTGASIRGAEKSRTAHVWTLRDGQPRRVEVRVGLDDDSYSEIAGGGLREGDAVIVSEHEEATARSGGAQLPGLVQPRR
jgi:HlyD family secretion protein